MTRHEHPESLLIVQTIARLRDALFLLEAVRHDSTGELLDEVHGFAHEAERLGERWAAVLGHELDARPTDTEWPSRGFGLAVENRVTLVRLWMSQGAMLFVASLDPADQCEHIAPLILRTRALLHALRRFDEDEDHFETIRAVAYFEECGMLGLGTLLDAAVPDCQRNIDALDLQALDALREERVPASFVRDVRGNRPFLTTDELVGALDDFMRLVATEVVGDAVNPDLD